MPPSSAIASGRRSRTASAGAAPAPAPRLDDPRLFPYTLDLPTEARAERLGLPRIARLDANETHLGPFPGAIEAAARSLGHAHRYPQHGSSLLERLAELHRIHEDSVVLAHGADPLIGYLAMALLERGDEAVMGAPSFVSYAQDVLRVGGRAIEVPVRSDGALDLPAMAERVTERTRLLFVCNPNNPTGGMLARREIEDLLDAVPATVLVVLDEAYAEYIEAPEYAGGPALAATRSNVVVLRTFSKLFGLAGLRIGYMLGPAAVVLAARRLRHWYDVSDAAHLAALACLGDPAEIARRADATRSARTRLTTILAAHGLTTLPSQASFVACPVRDASALAEQLAMRGVFVRPITDSRGDLVRIVAGADADLALLDAALGDVSGSWTGS